MARREVLEITCDRCGRTETQTSVETPKGGSPEVEAKFHGEVVSFNDLCKRCREAVKGYFSRIKKEEVAQKAAPPAPVEVEVPAQIEKKDEGKKKSFLGLGR